MREEHSQTPAKGICYYWAFVLEILKGILQFESKRY